MKKGSVALLSAVVFASIAVQTLIAETALAQTPVCVEDGGKAHCNPPTPDPYSLVLHDTGGSTVSESIARCTELNGGTFLGLNVGCVNTVPQSEGNMYGHAIAFTKVFLPGSSCSVSSDSGWGTTFSTPNCSGSPTYDAGYLTTITAPSTSPAPVATTSRSSASSASASSPPCGVP
jgi:hypothetical protein